MKAMKFKVNSPEHSKAIQEKLFEMGYEWSNVGSNVYRIDTPCLYAAKDGHILHSDNDDGSYNFFHKSLEYGEEHFLITDAQGTRFVTKDYWTQPKTPEQKPVERPPLGLRPRALFLQDRMAEIILAMGRYVEAGKMVPQEWIEELAQNNMEVGE